MKEITGNLWDFHSKPSCICCITTNGFVRRNGEAVMGRGCALEAVTRYPNLASLLGSSIEANGNKLTLITLKDHTALMAFPVKHNWYEKADFVLIASSATQLAGFANAHPQLKFILPRPGCGNGNLSWNAVRGIIKDILPDNVLVITNTEAQQ